MKKSVCLAVMVIMLAFGMIPVPDIFPAWNGAVTAEAAQKTAKKKSSKQKKTYKENPRLSKTWVNLKNRKSVKITVKGTRKKISAVSSDKSLVKVSRSGKYAIRLKAANRKKGVAVVRVKTSKGYQYILVCVGKGTNMSAKTKNWAAKGHLSTSQSPRLKYSYEVYSIDAYGANFYSRYPRPIYIKTNNPYDEDFLEVVYSDGYGGVTKRYSDVGFIPGGSHGALSAVPGGYLINIGFEHPGPHTVELYELQADGEEIKAGSFTVNVLDTDQLESQWIDQMIQQYTNPQMSPVDKMRALSTTFAGHALGGYFKYYDTMNGKVIRLARNSGAPYFIRRTTDSFESPAFMCKFASRIGGLENIHNCYYDYPAGTDGWSKTHYLMTCTYQGKKYSFSACPMLGSNVHTSIDMINFYNTEQFHRYM